MINLRICKNIWGNCWEFEEFYVKLQLFFQITFLTWNNFPMSIARMLYVFSLHWFSLWIFCWSSPGWWVNLLPGFYYLLSGVLMLYFVAAIYYLFLVYKLIMMLKLATWILLSGVLILYFVATFYYFLLLYKLIPKQIFSQIWDI